MSVPVDYMGALRAFHSKFGFAIGAEPGWRQPGLRANLIEEEAKETVDAIREGNMVEAVDGICDLLYVVFGTAVSFGIDVEKYFNEVHATNMAKETGEIRGDGKLLKPPGWQPPKISEMLAEDGWF